MNELSECPCGSGERYAFCCRPLHEGQPAPGAERLMRSRYSAFVLELDEYLLRSWHPSTRPASLRAEAGGGKTRWLGLQVKRSESVDENRALVEFVARGKIGGRAFRLHETSRFVREDGHWFYVDGEVAPH